MKDLRTIILAAGKGTRMNSDVPKVLHEVCGQPILKYVLDVAQSVGSLKTFVVVGHHADAVKRFLPKNVETVIQKELRGTADAVKSARAHFKNFTGDVLILCGDTPLLRGSTIKDLVQLHTKTQAVCTLLTADHFDPQGYGRIIRDKNAQPIAIREDKNASTEEKKISEINVGVYCIDSTALFKGLDEIKLNPIKNEFYLTDLIELFVSKKLKVEALKMHSAKEGSGINTRIDLQSAEKEINQRTLEALMLSGVTIVDASTTFIAADAKIGQDSVIKPFTVIENDVVVGKNCSIGPFAHLRPGTRLGNEVEIGNFAEVSRTTIGDKTLMKHFSFLGDAQVGSQVNIGAGTITANYDGQNKHQTQIGDQAFIGSDSILVAPVKVGKKSMVGAGSVVTKGRDVPDGKIAVGVPARILSKRKG